MTTTFNWDSWRKAALTYAETAEAISGLTDQVAPLGDVKVAGADSNVTTLIDDAVAAIFPASIGAVLDTLAEVATQVGYDAAALYATAQLYHDIEADNTLASDQIGAALAESPFNS